MNLMTLRILQREVARQCRFALISIELLNGANAGLQQSQGTEQRAQRDQSTNQLWYAIQNFLIASGNLSKFLWGTTQGNAAARREREQQRRKLRQSLGVADNSILKLSPDFRNHFEHLDERIEDWSSNSLRHNIVQDLIGPTNMISGIDEGDLLRSYDPAQHTLSFRGEVFEIVPVVHAIETLLPKAEEESDKPHWEAPPRPAPDQPAGSVPASQ